MAFNIDYFPYQCAICGIQWNRESGPEPPRVAPHNHTESDWQRFFADHSLDPKTARRWVRIDTVTYPDPPPWPQELGPAPPPYQPQLPRPPTTGYATG